MDRFLIYAPNWIKNSAVVLLIALFLAAFGLAGYAFQTGENRDLIAPAFSAAQAAAIGIIILGVLSFTERDASPDALLKKSKGWLNDTLRDAIERARIDADGALKVRGMKLPELVFADFTVALPGHEERHELSMAVFLNVKRLWVYYRIPCPSDADRERIEAAFAATFAGAIGGGYEMTRERKAPEGARPPTHEFHLSAPIDPDFLMKPTEQLYWAQDIASMTRSLLAAAIHHDIRLTVGRG